MTRWLSLQRGQQNTEAATQQWVAALASHMRLAEAAPAHAAVALRVGLLWCGRQSRAILRGRLVGGAELRCLRHLVLVATALARDRRGLLRRLPAGCARHDHGHHLAF